MEIYILFLIHRHSGHESTKSAEFWVTRHLKRKWRGGGLAQAIELMPCKQEALNSNPITAKKSWSWSCWHSPLIPAIQEAEAGRPWGWGQSGQNRSVVYFTSMQEAVFNSWESKRVKESERLSKTARQGVSWNRQTIL
jgi:hypothetical protein